MNNQIEQKKPKYIPVREEACEIAMLYKRIDELKEQNERLRVEVRSLQQLVESK